MPYINCVLLLATFARDHNDTKIIQQSLKIARVTDKFLARGVYDHYIMINARRLEIAEYKLVTSAEHRGWSISLRPIRVI